MSSRNSAEADAHDDDDGLSEELEELIATNSVLIVGRSMCRRCERARAIVAGKDRSGDHHLFVDFDADTDDSGRALLRVLALRTFGQKELPVVFVRGQLQTLADLEMMATSGLLQKRMRLEQIRHVQSQSHPEQQQQQQQHDQQQQQQQRWNLLSMERGYEGEDEDDDGDDAEFADAVSDEDPASLAVDESSIACPAARSSSTPGEAQKAGKKSSRRWKQLRRQVRKRTAKATGKRHWFARRQDRAAAAAAAAAAVPVTTPTATAQRP
jgi:hypothetical protein